MLKPPQPALRLPPISYIPGLDDLISQAKQSQRNTNRNVELPWQTAGIDKQYILTCCFCSHRDLVSRRDKAEISGTVWSLSYTSPVTLKTTTVWQYTSEDVSLIHNLLNAEVEGVPIQLVLAKGTATTPGTGPNPSQMMPVASTSTGGYAQLVIEHAQDSGAFSDSDAAPQRGSAYQSGVYAAQSGLQASQAQFNSGPQPTQFNTGSQPVAQFGSGAGTHQNLAPPSTHFPSGSYPQLSSKGLQSGSFSQPQIPQNGDVAPTTMQLAGSIQQVQIMDVLQSINVCRMTGRLDVDDIGNRTTLYFHSGEPVHAMSENTLAFEQSSQQGIDSILDVLTWETGMFRFQPDLTTRDHTITRKLSSILLEGAALSDYTREVSDLGVTLESILVRSDTVKSWEEVQKQLQTGLPLDTQQQVKFCMAFDGKKSIGDVVKELNLTKSVWLPMVFNLLKISLLKTSAKSTRVHTKSYQIDANTLDLAQQNLLRPETGMLSFPMLLFFIVKEFARFRMERYPISLVVFGITCTRTNGQTEPLSNDCIKAIAANLKTTCTELDTFGHFETTDFALLLPYKRTDEAKEFATNLAKSLPSVLPQQFLQQGLSLQLSFGIASAPTDGDSPEIILGLARSFKEQSQAKGGGMIICSQH